MSEGTSRYTFRLDDALVSEVIATLHHRNLHSAEQPMDLSDFVRAALREKVDKMTRSRAGKEVSDTPVPEAVLPKPLATARKGSPPEKAGPAQGIGRTERDPMASSH